MYISDLILNMLIVSIPEELFIVLTTLVLMGRYDFIDKYTVKQNFPKIFFIAVLPTVLFFTFTLFMLDINIYLRVFINSLAFIAFMKLLTGDKITIRFIFSSIIAYFLLIPLESLTGPLLISVFKVNAYIGNSDPIMNFWMSLPNRIIQYAFLYIVYLSKNSIVKVKLFDMWRFNGIFRRLIYISIIFNMLIASFIYNKFAVERCIESLNFESQMSIIIVILIMFIYILTLPWVAVYSVYPSERLRNHQR